MKNFLIFIFCILLTGCGTKENTNITRPVVHQEIPITEKTKEIANDLSLMQDKTMLLYKGGVSHDLDLNQDGEKEEIFYEEGNFIDGNYIQGKLLVNSVDYSNLIKDMYQVSDSFTIGKIKEQYFLMITSLMDNDYTDTRIFIYDNELKCVCESMEGSPENDLFMYDDLLHTRELTNVLGTDYIDVIYEWNGTEFSKVIPAEGLYSYDVYDGRILKTLEEMIVYQNRNLNNPIMLPTGTEFTSNMTDGNCWSNVITEDAEYWFYNYDFEDISFFEKIEGLIFAG